jgi:hypothetical protein
MTDLSKQLEAFHEGSPFTQFDEATGKGLDRPEPTEAELDGYVAPGRAATHPVGVLYRADFETLDDGMCRQARLHSSALSRAGVPVALRSIQNRVRHGADSYRCEGATMLAPVVWAQVGSLMESSLTKTALVVIHTVLGNAQVVWRLVAPQSLQGNPKAIESALKGTIVYAPWESDRASRDLVSVLSRCAQVWLQCERNVQAFVSSGLPLEKIRLVPNAYSPGHPVCRPPLRVPIGKRFYTIGKWEPRKNQLQLIGAFLRTFPPGEHAILTVKTHDFRPWTSYPAPEKAIPIWLKDPRVIANGWTTDNVARHVVIETRTLREVDIARLHHMNNIYVSPSHAEGWDYPAFDAVSAGNSLIHVGYGGSEDYASDSSSPVTRLQFSETEVDADYNWERGSRWADYPIEELEAALVRTEPPRARAHPRAFSKYTEENVGKLMRRYIAEAAASVSPELLVALR